MYQLYIPKCTKLYQNIPKYTYEPYCTSVNFCVSDGLVSLQIIFINEMYEKQSNKLT